MDKSLSQQPFQILPELRGELLTLQRHRHVGFQPAQRRPGVIPRTLELTGVDAFTKGLLQEQLEGAEYPVARDRGVPGPGTGG